MDHFSRMPNDLQCLVLHHRAAIVIQRYMRDGKFKCYTQTKNWASLRRKLGSMISSDDFDTLLKCAQVRQEWYQEPESWLYELDKDSSQIFSIINEVRSGMWKL